MCSELPRAQDFSQEGSYSSLCCWPPATHRQALLVPSAKPRSLDSKGSTSPLKMEKLKFLAVQRLVQGNPTLGEGRDVEVLRPCSPCSQVLPCMPCSPRAKGSQRLLPGDLSPTGCPTSPEPNAA